jgi:YaaC-like Protein
MPPGLAGSDHARRATYAAALQQFDDLMEASRVVGPVSRPLPLYYAVHQAGKAIAAAWTADDWRVGGHGLAQDRAEEYRAAWEADVLRFRVKPRGHGAFGAVATALGTPLTGSVEMGAVWSALPEVSPPSEDGRWLAALPVTPAAHATNTSDALLGYVSIRGQPAPPDPVSVNSLLARYPDAQGARGATFNQQLQGNVTSWGLGVAVSWPADQPASGSLDPPLPLTSYVAFRLPLYQRTTERWLVPEVGDGSDRLSPVLLWWILLHGLSLLTRYEPAAWRAALDLDSSPIADPLTELLDQALEIVPDLLHDTVTSDLAGGPRIREPWIAMMDH